MQSLPDGFDIERLPGLLQTGWGITPAQVTYAPLGFGSYHWIVEAETGLRFFVTVDDLDDKPWLGSTRDTAYDGLVLAFDTSLTLHSDQMLEFVVAPIPGLSGVGVLRVADRYALSVYPYVDGVAGEFGGELDPDRRTAVVDLLARLHRASPLQVRPRVDVPFADRASLEKAVSEPGAGWSPGPYSGPAHLWLREHAAGLRRRLDEFDRLQGSLSGRPLTITHGEPHPGNMLSAAGGLLLIDWDTVALAPPERDLWLVHDPEGAALGEYEERTGYRADHQLLSMYRLAWDLSDVAAYLAVLRSARVRTADTEEAWQNITGMTSIDGPPRR